jgi:uncharacterized protein (TIGR00369 family)
MKTKNPHYQARVKEIFEQAAFIQELGVKLEGVSPGFCKTSLELQPKHFQQDQLVHAGIQASLADHTAGGAAGTLIGADEIVLTVEFKINLLRPAWGERLRCQARVLKPGKMLTIAESEVLALKDGSEILVSKATVTLAIKKRRLDPMEGE